MDDEDKKLEYATILVMAVLFILFAIVIYKLTP